MFDVFLVDVVQIFAGMDVFTMSMQFLSYFISFSGGFFKTMWWTVIIAALLLLLMVIIIVCLVIKRPKPVAG